MEEPTFTVTLHHLAPDARQMGANFPDTDLPSVTGRKLRELIRALAAIATRDPGAATPELRIGAPHGRFIVRVGEGRLRITSWDIRVGGTDFSPDQIVGLITGGDVESGGGGDDFSASGKKRSPRGWVGILVALIIATNVITAWMITRPPPNPFLPEFTPLAPEQTERLLVDVAGEYQTGANEGDRALTITRDGRVRWVKFGPKRAIIESADLKSRAVQSRGQRALLADDRALITFPDPATVVFYNETYRRQSP